MPDLVEFRTRGRIGLAVIDNPPVNALSHGVRAGLAAAIDRFEEDAGLDALIILCAGDTFFSGADIKEFGRPLADPQLGDVIGRIEQASKPIVAAIHGRALGGGLEVALGCHYRVAVPSARIGLPEVKLGILPGAGGTQRLPRLVGLVPALTMITEGGEVPAPKAKEMGAIDALIDGDLEDGAVAITEKLLADGAQVRRTGALPPPANDPALFEETKKALAKKRRGYEAPQVAVDAVRLSCSLPFDAALAEEYALCKVLLASPQSKALRHMFAAERVVARVPGLADDIPVRPVDKAAVVGIGVMGAGIAMLFANADIPVVAVRHNQDKLDKALARIGKAYAAQVERGSLGQAEADRRMALIRPTTAYEALADVDLVIEAVAEDMAVKQAVFTALGAATRPGTILASNTSYLDIDALAEASGRPADVCGMHFFNPPTVMRLLENVRAAKTAPDVLKTVMAVGKRIGKLPILSGLCDGFIVNRMLAKRSREGLFMLEEGAKPAQIDKVLTGFGFPMGPYALADLAGIDVQYAARQARMARLTEREKAANFVDQLHAKGRLGQKTGAGWYRYGENRKTEADPEIDAMLAAHATARGIAQRLIGDQEVLERCLYAMVNEGAKIIEEGVVPRPDEIDVAMVNGVGFPAFTGGPMWWADSIGLAKIRDAMLRYRDVAGAEYWTPAPLLDRLVRESKGFYDQ